MNARIVGVGRTGNDTAVIRIEISEIRNLNAPETVVYMKRLMRALDKFLDRRNQ